MRAHTTPGTFVVRGQRYHIAWRLGSRLAVGVRVVWNFNTSVITSIDPEDPAKYGKRIRYFYSLDDRTGETIKMQFVPQERYRVEVAG